MLALGAVVGMPVTTKEESASTNEGADTIGGVTWEEDRSTNITQATDSIRNDLNAMPSTGICQTEGQLQCDDGLAGLVSQCEECGQPEEEEEWGAVAYNETVVGQWPDDIAQAMIDIQAWADTVEEFEPWMQTNIDYQRRQERMERRVWGYGRPSTDEYGIMIERGSSASSSDNDEDFLLSTDVLREEFNH